jgi:hypothetical protein
VALTDTTRGEGPSGIADKLAQQQSHLGVVRATGDAPRSRSSAGTGLAAAISQVN